MSRDRREYFTLHELLTMAALAALGGVTSSVVSLIRAAAHTLIVIPGGMQYLAGIHVLWLVLAVALIRKPGAATVAALLKGVVELLSGNPHGLLVLMYSLFAGATVDVVWMILGGGGRLHTCMLAGATGATSNLLVLVFAASLPPQENMLAAIVSLACASFISGALLAGVLGWWLLRALALAGAIGAVDLRGASAPRSSAWRRLGLVAVVIAAVWAVVRVATSPPDAATTASRNVRRTTVSQVALPP